MPKLFRRYLLIHAVFCCVITAANAGETPQRPRKIRHWAILIGAAKYERELRLCHTANDVKCLAETLEGRGGFDRNHIISIIDPRCADLRTQLSTHLSKVKSADHLILYFSGHGVINPANKQLYLAPVDFDRENIEKTGVELEWIRAQLAECPAAFKLLILDACHAGSLKGAEDVSLPREQLDTLRTAGLVTLASSTAQESSLMWNERHQSLFSYWLNEGLKGHADLRGQGYVDIDHLYQYISDNVTRSAPSVGARKQTPVRIILPDTVGVPKVLELVPQPLESVIADIAKQIAVRLRLHEIKTIGVLEFANETPTGWFFHSDFGLLNQYCAKQLERGLRDQSTDSFEVKARDTLLKAIKNQNFTLDGLKLANSLRALDREAGGLNILVAGCLANRAGESVPLRCRLIRTDSGEVMGEVGGLARLERNELLMLGRSLPLVADGRKLPGHDKLEEIGHSQLRFLAGKEFLARLDDAAKGSPHPLQDPHFPYQVRVMVDNEERKGKFSGNDYFVPLSVGEKYEIQVANPTRQTVVMRLLVDGLNTLPQNVVTKGVGLLEAAPRVNLNEARPWVLEPKGNAKEPFYAVRGFATITGAQGEWKPFEVVDAAQSIAARKQFTDQIGLITIDFCEPSTLNPRRVGTWGGRPKRVDLTESDIEAGRTMYIVNIRYVDPREMPAN